MHRAVILLACLIGPSACWADSAVTTGIRLECLQALRQFRFQAETVIREDLEATAPKEAIARFLAQARKEGLFVEGKHTYRCVINGVVLLARVFIEKPRERGECGGDPGGTITVTASGKEVLAVQFGNYCFPSAWSGSIAFPYYSAYAFPGMTVCAYGRFESDGDKKPKCTSMGLPTGNEPAFGRGELEKLVGDGTP